MAKITKAKISLPFGIGSVEIDRHDVARKAAWELYIELTTRVSVQPLSDSEGLFREALTSLYSIFGSTRDVLRRAGPSAGATRQSVGGVAIQILNRGLRPFLSRWHPRLEQWESCRKAEVGKQEHELAWEHLAEAREGLRALQRDLRRYATALKKIARV